MKNWWKPVVSVALAALFAWQAWAAEDIWKIHGTPGILNYSTVSLQSTAFGSQTYRVRLICTTDCYASFSATNASPSANASSATGMFLPASVPEVFIVPPNGIVAVIQASASGVLSITELTK